MKLTGEDIVLLVGSLNRAISRHETELRYATDGRGNNNPKKVGEKIKKLKNLRDRLLQALVTIANEQANQ